MSIEITLGQAKELVECFGGDEELVLNVVKGDEKFHSGKGLYVHDEYPDHGCLFLGKGGMSKTEEINWAEMFKLLEAKGGAK